MRLASALVGDRPTVALVEDGNIFPLPEGAPWPGLKGVLAAGALEEAAALARSQRAADASALSFLPLIPDPGKVLCVGVNYLPHIREMGREPPPWPTLFVRFAESLVGHGEPLRVPAASSEYDYEGELAIVIGRPAYRIRRQDVADCIAGYTCLMDGSARDWQRHTSQFTAGKNFPASGSLGPWLVTPDELQDPAQLRLETRINGEVMQSASIGEMCFDVPAIVEYCATFCQLMPGDVISTGTPGGVGFARSPPRWLRPGDRVEVEITGVGTLSNPVAA
ncbi:MAG: fumarylacetoacetate hydrolase family protein [Chromatiales bacterium]|nr:fumarylacetoacetate hydrolase family protein [Chromatiales bacterium]